MSRRKNSKLSISAEDDESVGIDMQAANMEPLDFPKPYFSRGNNAVYINFIVMIVGIVIVFTSVCGTGSAAFGRYTMSFGLFGLAGGVTNWVAVYMLFEKVPYLYGSGVIPVRYVEIRATVKDVIMNTFFDPVFLEGFIGDKLKAVGATVDTDSKVKAMVESEAFDATLDEKLKTLDADPAMAMLAGFGGAAALKPMIKPFVADLGLELAPLIKNKLTDPKFAINITTVRDEIEKYMSIRMQTLTSKKVTRLLEFVIRGHLGWLIVWGNVFGALIGIVSEGARLTPQYKCTFNTTQHEWV